MNLTQSKYLLALGLAAASISASADHYDYTPEPAKPTIVAKATQPQAATMSEPTSDKPAEKKVKSSTNPQFEIFWKEFTRLSGG